MALDIFDLGLFQQSLQFLHFLAQGRDLLVEQRGLFFCRDQVLGLFGGQAAGIRQLLTRVLQQRVDALFLGCFGLGQFIGRQTRGQCSFQLTAQICDLILRRQLIGQGLGQFLFQGRSAYDRCIRLIHHTLQSIQSALQIRLGPFQFHIGRLFRFQCGQGLNQILLQQSKLLFLFLGLVLGQLRLGLLGL